VFLNLVATSQKMNVPKQKFRATLVQTRFGYFDIEKTDKEIQEVIDGKRESCSFQCLINEYHSSATVRKLTNNPSDYFPLLCLKANVGDVIIDHGPRVPFRYSLLVVSPPSPIFPAESVFQCRYLGDKEIRKFNGVEDVKDPKDQKEMETYNRIVKYLDDEIWKVIEGHYRDDYLNYGQCTGKYEKEDTRCNTLAVIRRVTAKDKIEGVKVGDVIIDKGTEDEPEYRYLIMIAPAKPEDKMTDS
jgi:hypothetical protein